MDQTPHMEGSGTAYWWVAFVTRLPRYKFLLRKRWWILALCVAAGSLGAAWLVVSQPVLYTSASRLVVSGKISIQENASYSEEVSNFFGTQIEWMMSSEIHNRAVERLAGLYPGLKASPVRLNASQLSRTSIFVLTATGGDPDYTQKFLDACVDEYIDARKQVRSDKSDSMLSTLTDQLTKSEKDVRDSEEELLDFQRKNNVASLQDESASTSSYLAKLNQQLADLQTEYKLLDLLNLDQAIASKRTTKNLAEDATGAPAGADSVLKADAAEGDYLHAKQEIEVLKAKQAELAKVLRPKHPDMIQLKQDIDRQETLINAFRSQTLDQLKTRRQSIEIQKKNLDDTIKDWNTKSLDLNQKLAEYNKIKSKEDRAKANYDSILASSRSVDESKNVDQDMVSIMERASPALPVRPTLAKTITLGVVASFAVGVAILFLLDKIDDRMNSFGEFQAHFSEEVLAKIPSERRAEDPVAFDAPDSRMAFVESMRALRSSLFYMPVDGKAPKTLLITSAVPNEGKSTVALNLAITMSFAGSKVLLIDGDLRRGALHEKLGLDNSIGMGDVIKDQGTLDKAIRPTRIEHLSLISRGANVEHPGEYYLSRKADALLQAIYERFDYVIFDSSPVLVADDTTSLAPKIDATIFVVRFSFSSARRSRDAIEALKKRQANLIGIVCNSVNHLMQDYYYNKYPEYYAVKRDA